MNVGALLAAIGMVYNQLQDEYLGGGFDQGFAAVFGSCCTALAAFVKGTWRKKLFDGLLNAILFPSYWQYELKSGIGT
jgi:hypothetical protein